MNGPLTGDAPFDDVLGEIEPIDGWLTDAQARLLWDSARVLRDGQAIVEIGSYQGRSTVVLARASAPGVRLTAIDPHAGTDRGPQEITGKEIEAEGDSQTFLRNLEAAGVRDRVSYLRRWSHDALAEHDGPIDLLYIDGAHRFTPARDDIRRWGARVVPGGTLLIHDSFSSVGRHRRHPGRAHLLGPLALHGPRHLDDRVPPVAAARRRAGHQRRPPARRAAVVRAQRRLQGAGAGRTPRRSPSASASTPPRSGPTSCRLTGIWASKCDRTSRRAQMPRMRGRAGVSSRGGAGAGPPVAGPGQVVVVDRDEVGVAHAVVGGRNHAHGVATGLETGPPPALGVGLDVEPEDGPRRPRCRSHDPRHGGRGRTAATAPRRAGDCPSPRKRASSCTTIWGWASPPIEPSTARIEPSGSVTSAGARVWGGRRPGP